MVDDSQFGDDLSIDPAETNRSACRKLAWTQLITIFYPNRCAVRYCAPVRIKFIVWETSKEVDILWFAWTAPRTADPCFGGLFDFCASGPLCCIARRFPSPRAGPARVCVAISSGLLSASPVHLLSIFALSLQRGRRPI